MHAHSVGFEEDERLRSDFIRALTLAQLEHGIPERRQAQPHIPRRLLQFWHDLDQMPDDVRACVDSWSRLREQGFDLYLFDDESAAAYIAKSYSQRECKAFSRCRHPAMRSDYLRLCFILAEGGLYVDTDDVLLGDGWMQLFTDGRLKLQPLCYDIEAQGMLPAPEIWNANLSSAHRIFYVNNDPLAAPPGHPVVSRALARATDRLLSGNPRPEIQSTTGPGNLTAALAAHARVLVETGAPPDFELLRNWDAIAETRWNLTYRNDSRNWRLMNDA